MKRPLTFKALSTPALSSVSMALEDRIDMPRPDFIPSLTAVEEPKHATALRESILPDPDILKYSLIIFNVPDPVSLKIKGSLDIFLSAISFLPAHLCFTETTSTSSSSHSSQFIKSAWELFDPITPSSSSPLNTRFSISLVSAIVNLTIVRGCFS